jgi:hypothetical protein
MWKIWIKKYFDANMTGYTAEGIKTFVSIGWITADDYKEITGDDYVAA